MLGSTPPPWSSPLTSRSLAYWPALDPTFHVASATPTPARAWFGSGFLASAGGTTSAAHPKVTRTASVLRIGHPPTTTVCVPAGIEIEITPSENVTVAVTPSTVTF